MKNLPIVMILAISTLGGCGAPDEGLDESVAVEFEALTDAPFRLVNYQTGLCMGVAGGNPTWGTKFVTWYCDWSANQYFTKQNSSTAGYVYLRNQVADRHCVVQRTLTNGSLTVSDPCFGFDNQEAWKPIYAGTNLQGKECYRFESRGAPGKVFGVSGGSTAVGTSIILWDDFKNQWTHPDQIWCVY